MDRFRKKTNSAVLVVILLVLGIIFYNVLTFSCSKVLCMNHVDDFSRLALEADVIDQIRQCRDLVLRILGRDALGVYLYGSAVVGGLQAWSDIDIFVVSRRSTSDHEKIELARSLMGISGIYMKGDRRPLEVTIVERSAINPWRYPPDCDFQYGEWLREEFHDTDAAPWSPGEMPDLAVLIPQLVSAHVTLAGQAPDQLLCNVPYHDVIRACGAAVPHLMGSLEGDCRNVLLTLARIWNTVSTGQMLSKPAAAAWALERLPQSLRPVMVRARAICCGEHVEEWGDLAEQIRACATCMRVEIERVISECAVSGGDKSEFL